MSTELDMADLVIGRQQRRITQLERMVEHLAEQVAGYQQQEAERMAQDLLPEPQQEPGDPEA